MATTARSILVRFLGDEKDLSRASRAASGDLDKVGASADNSADRLTSFGAKSVAGAGIAAVGLYKLAMGASDLNETVSKSKVIFGAAQKQVDEFASGASKSLGMSKQSALDAAATFGVFGKSAKLTGPDLAQFSTDLVRLSGDLASFSNTSPEDAIEAIGAALRGEAEPIRRYGVLLDEATLKNRALAMGLIETTTGTLPPAIKVQAAYAEILAQTTDAQGDFARTADGAANQQRILKAELKNLADSTGQTLLPALKGAVTGASTLVDWLGKIPGPAKTALGTFAVGSVGIVGAVGGISMVIGQVQKMHDKLTDASGALNFAGKASGIAAIALTGFSIVTGMMAAKAEEARKRLDDMRKIMQETGDTAEEAAARQMLQYIQANQDIADKLDGAGVAVEEVRDAIQGSEETYDRIIKKINDYVDKKNEERAAGSLTADAEIEDALSVIRTIDRQRDQIKQLAKEKENAATISKQLGKTEVEIAKERQEAAKAEEQAQKEAAAAWKEHTEAIKRAIDAKKDQIDQVRADADAEFAYRKSVRDTADALRDMTDKIKEATDARGKDAKKNDEAAAAVDDFKESLLDQAEAYAKSTGALDGSKASVDAQIKKLGELRNQYGEKLPEIGAYLDEYIGKLQSAARASTSIVVPGFEGVVNTGNGGRVRARGGNVIAGVPYTVGEEGEELFVPDQSGTIVPHDVWSSSAAGAASASFGGGGLGGVTVHVHVYGSVLTERDLIDTVRAGLIDVDRYTAGAVLSATG